MTYVIFLTLDESGPKPYLKVVKKHQEIDRNTNGPQKISWHLSQNAYKGEVRTFTWLDTPPLGTFGPAVATPAGKHFNMEDDNASADSAGTFAYELTAKIGSKIYSTTQPVTTAGTNDPTIRNR
jgi:hypothetical protein